MHEMTGVIIIGAGQAAASFVAKFRALDQKTALTIYGDEPEIPYQRPPLSKKYATGDMAKAQLYLRPETWYSDQNIRLKTSVEVTSIDRTKRTVHLSDGTIAKWTKLMIATGSRVRELPQSVTNNLSGLHYVRTLEDADHFGEVLKSGRRIVIVGGGYIGLEAAAVCAQKGMKVTLVEAGARILQRVACEETSAWFKRLHVEEGIDIKEGVGLSHFEGQGGKLTRAVLSDKSVIDAEVAVVGIGILPNTELAEACELVVENGIVVNGVCQTNDPDIYAAGDCAVTDYNGISTRLESVPNAIDQATVAGIHAATGAAPNYVAKPWFWSDQFDVKLQIAGLNRGYTSVVTRPGKTSRSMAHFYYRGDTLLAIDAMNAPSVYMIGKRLLEAGKTIPPGTCS
jgi:3-phenylpropionate/trans-cinnamate dioxygenase ferredoxin reductase subunit